MCMSNVYLRERDEGSLIVEDASRVIESNGMVEVATLFGEEKSFKGYSINEVNLLENYIILKLKGVNRDA